MYDCLWAPLCVFGNTVLEVWGREMAGVQGWWFYSLLWFDCTCTRCYNFLLPSHCCLCCTLEHRQFTYPHHTHFTHHAPSPPPHTHRGDV